MKYRTSTIFVDDFSALKADFEAVLDMLVEDIRCALGMGVLQTMGFKATEEFLKYVKTNKHDGSKESLEAKKLYDYVVECKGLIGLKSGTIRIPLNILYEKIATVNPATAIHTFETVYEILNACVRPAIQDLQVLYLKSRDEGDNVKEFFRIADQWDIGLFTIKKELDEYKDELKVKPNSLPYYPGFTYAKRGEDDIKSESSKLADPVVVVFHDDPEINSLR